MNKTQAQAVVDVEIKRNQDTVSNQFELLLQRSKVRSMRKVVPMSEDTFQKTMAFLDKLEEMIDLELL